MLIEGLYRISIMWVASALICLATTASRPDSGRIAAE